MTNPFLVGKSIYLRPLERQDASTVQPWINDPVVRRTLNMFRPTNLQAEEAFIERINQDPNAVALVIVHMESDKPIGVCGLNPVDWKNRHALFGIAIGEKEFWGRGIGREATDLVAEYAFETLNLNRLYLHVFEFHERGMRSYASVGFHPEGILREDTFREGRYWNTVIMGLLRKEWQARQIREKEAKGG